jgi:PilZ domain
MTFAMERRASIRHSTAHNQTNVQLMEGSGPRIATATLVNISHHGALILTGDVAVLHQPLNVHFESAPESRWIAAQAVRFGQLHEVGIRFERPCSRRILESAST